MLVILDLWMVEADWAALPSYPAPLRLGRNVSILGAFEPQAQWPSWDMGFLRGKVLLAAGVTLSLGRLVLLRAQQAPQSGTFGLDLVSAELDPASAATAPVVRLQDVAAVQEACLPGSLRVSSAAATPRPEGFPGSNSPPVRLTYEPGCINSTAAPATARCWPARDLYGDFAAYAARASDDDAVPVREGYVVHLINMALLCGLELGEECVATLGPRECRLSLAPQASQPPQPLPPTALPAAAEEAPVGAGLGALRPEVAGGGAGGAAGTGAGGGGSAGKSSLLEPLLTGILVGAVALTAVTVLAVLAARAWRRRQRRRRAANTFVIYDGPAAAELAPSPPETPDSPRSAAAAGVPSGVSFGGVGVVGGVGMASNLHTGADAVLLGWDQHGIEATRTVKPPWGIRGTAALDG
ncbi:hypothetical protein GPECTOR_57g489 [Gonium pectorale]|uniref:Uncharacterized protein n=1 Tax=Gonium pectorale TaxID=33097 RepID=A0A150G5P0_GONPE|nr:hypothetical protein GPECTOR_57g489 [Gonium pectorale]|eukprot:KXZ45199.1 hypothetical protein GPECTOR_57g489 [Gonium pectorale]